AFNCISQFDDVLKAISADNDSTELAKSLAEHSLIASYCLYENDKRVFNSALEALNALTINQLCDIYQQYIALESEGLICADFCQTDKKTS
ncbi:MAG: hypothetical protein RSE93_01175, partial [Oscillospiraceae bacterium]